jgi:hypothetical protein
MAQDTTKATQSLGGAWEQSPQEFPGKRGESLASPDNAQLTEKKVNPIDLAWLAGFVDGEGTIGLTQEPERRTVRIQFTVGNTNEFVMDEARKITEAILGRSLHFINQKSHRGYRPLLVLRRGGFEDVRKLCLALVPYLRAKRRQAELVLEFLSLAPGKYGCETKRSVIGQFTKGQRYSARCLEIASEMRYLNRRYARNAWVSSPQQETELPAPKLGEETVRSAWRHAEPDRNDLASELIARQ